MGLKVVTRLLVYKKAICENVVGANYVTWRGCDESNQDQDMTADRQAARTMAKIWGRFCVVIVRLLSYNKQHCVRT